ncbi:iron-sulfur protein [Amycolatopsis thailandensis]|uniref:Iron-sulfur protein n=1 Tax=Amycolatopsis thailandensis TaxID=589330 RepID=A0A229RNN1_9PSEU|nr:(2Fe-2S)-binding protein [Amycolatopsis thailandensis]OXM48079.1 iron-sulfur protein [Amycolatopsis thailandensis]
MSRHRVIASPEDGLRASLSRLPEDARVRADIPEDEPGWVRCADLLGEPARLVRWRERLGGWLAAEYPEAPGVPERTPASWILSWYLHVPAFAGAMLLHHARRVPSLAPSALAFRIGDGRPHPDSIAVLGGGFHCLPTDPGSARRETVVVPDERVLATVLRGRFVAHASRFIDVYGPLTRLGRRQLWAAATDALDNALWSAGRLGGTPEAEGAGVADAALVLESRFPPLTSASKLRLVPGADGRREWTRNRESCCFSYLLPAESECGGCPRIR